MLLPLFLFARFVCPFMRMSATQTSAGMSFASIAFSTGQRYIVVTFIHLSFLLKLLSFYNFQVKAQCPLCRRSFTSIIHNVRSNGEYDELIIPVGYLSTWEPGVPHPGPSLALLHLRDSVRARVRQTPRSDPLHPGRSSQTSPRALLLREERREKQAYRRLRFSSEVAPAPVILFSIFFL